MKRNKYNRAVQVFLKLAESLTIKFNQHFVADFNEYSLICKRNTK